MRVVAISVLGLAVPASAVEAGQGRSEVETTEGVWHDLDRQRDVPFKAYFPAEAGGRVWPVILFSHGLGGTREAAGYLGQFLASHGYACFHLQHPGTDDSIWAEGVSLRNARLALRDWRSTLDRFRDVPFAIEAISRLAGEEGPFEGRLDLTRIGMSGHSYGAVSTLVAAGQRLGSKLSFREPRIRAAIAYSPAPPQREPDPEQTWADIAVPLLHFTGTQDTSEVRKISPSDRRIPFDRISGVDQVLVILEGGDHMIFSGRPRASAQRLRPRDARHREIIEQVSLEFWDAYLRDDGSARDWLFADGIRTTVAGDASIEVSRHDRGVVSIKEVETPAASSIETFEATETGESRR